MKRKDYINEELTEEEIKYIRGIIWKSARKCVRDELKIKEKEVASLYSENINPRLLMTDDEYSFLDRNLVNNYINAELKSEPFSIEEQKNIVELLENIAKVHGLDKYIKRLTFKEKLVVFLIYAEGYKVNKISKLLNISRKTFNYRYKCIREKTKKDEGNV